MGALATTGAIGTTATDGAGGKNGANIDAIAMIGIATTAGGSSRPEFVLLVSRVLHSYSHSSSEPALI